MKDSKNKNILLLGISLLFVLIAAYANHFENEFHFDDFHTIVNNPNIRTLSNIPEFFTDPTMFSVSQNHYGLRPLVTTSLAVDYWLGGGQMYLFFFHFSTFIWFILLGLIMYFVYKKLLSNSFNEIWAPYVALFAVAWFMLHTANAETINYIIARSDVLSTFFIMASFAIYVLYPQKRKYYLYVIPAVIGVFAKETVLVLIMLLFFYVLLFERGLSIGDLFKAKNFKTVINTVWILLPVFLAVAAVQFYTLSAIKSIPGISNPAGYYWLTQTYVWVYYFTSFFFPVHLSADTDWTVITNILDRRIFIGIAFVVLLIVAIFKTSVKPDTKPVAFGLIWFAASLLPTSLAPFAEVMNDHRMFFAFVGLSLSVVSYIALLLRKREKKIATDKRYQSVVFSIALVILTLNAYGVHERNIVWRTEESLWYDVTIKSPLNGRGFMNYGLAQMAKGNFSTALEYYEKALPMLPAYSNLYINIGIAKGAIGKHEEAEQNFKMAIFFEPNHGDSYSYFARYLKERKKFEEAKAMGEKALTLNPQSILTLNVLMEVYNELELWGQLSAICYQTLSLLPNDPTALKYLNAAKTKEKVNNDIGQTKIENLNGKTPEELLNISLAFYNMGMYEKCIQICEQALKLKSDYAAAYSNISASYNKLEQWEKGAEAARKALKIDPNNEFAKGNLAWALSEKNP